MPARVTIEATVWSDARFEVLAALLGVDRYSARGRMAAIWGECTERETDRLSPVFVAVHLGCSPADAGRIMEQAELGEVIPPAGSQPAASHVAGECLVRIRGCEGRTEWLAEKRAAAAKGGKARAAKAKRGVTGAFQPAASHVAGECLDECLVSAPARAPASSQPESSPPAPAPAPALSSSSASASGRDGPKSGAASASLAARTELGPGSPGIDGQMPPLPEVPPAPESASHGHQGANGGHPGHAPPDLEPVRARYEAVGKELDPDGWQTSSPPARVREILEGARALVGPDEPLPSMADLLRAVDCAAAQVTEHRAAGDPDAVRLYRALWRRTSVLRQALDHPTPEHAQRGVRERRAAASRRNARAGPATPDPRYGRVEPKPWNEYDTSEEF